MRLFLLLLTCFGVIATAYGLDAVTARLRPIHALRVALAPAWWRLVVLVAPWLGLDVMLWHEAAVLAHTPCYACADLAPGWWDWDVDCAGHACGTCLECTDPFQPFGTLTSPGHRSSHTSHA